jgi:hypothetical protein
MGRKIDSRSVRAEIEAAFCDVPQPDRDQLVYDASYPDVAAIRDAFAGRAWKELDVSFLRSNVEAVNFLTPEGLRYYLPAFMIASMLEPKRADVIPLFLCLSLTPPKSGGSDFSGFRRRMEVFNPPQENAIREYLNYALEHLGIREAKRALHRFWAAGRT